MTISELAKDADYHLNEAIKKMSRLTKEMYGLPLTGVGDYTTKNLKDFTIDLEREYRIVFQDLNELGESNL